MSGAPLHGIRVIDLTTYLSGPYATQLLAGLGADVIKIERPLGGDPARRNPPYANEAGIHFGTPSASDQSLSLLKRNRGKRSVTLDLSMPEGREVFHRLLNGADLLVENFTPGVMTRLGLDPDQLLEQYPGLVIVSVSGFGQTGPFADRPAFDLVIQAMSGAMAVTGDPDRPPLRAGVALGDLAAALTATIGALAALRERDRSGHGQKVDVAMLDTLFALVMDEAPDVLEREGRPLRSGYARTRLTPFNVYPAQDGSVAIATASDAHWRSLLKAMGEDRLIEQNFYATLESRFQHASEVDAFVGSWTCGRSCQTIVDALADAGIACAKVATMADVLANPQLAARAMIEPVRHGQDDRPVGAATYAFPIQFSRSRVGFGQSSPALGAHTTEVLMELADLGADDVLRLAEKGVI